MPRAAAMPQAVFFGMAAENMYASFCYSSREVNMASIDSAIPAAGGRSRIPQREEPRTFDQSGPKSIPKPFYHCRRPVE